MKQKLGVGGFSGMGINIGCTGYYMVWSELIWVQNVDMVVFCSCGEKPN